MKTLFVLVALACDYAQSPTFEVAQAQADAPLSFDVASVKAITQGWIEVRPTRSPGRFTWSTRTEELVEYAYHMQPFQISGSNPARTNVVYRVDATLAPSATEDQVRLMLQSFLADRFKMACHPVTKEAEGYNLNVMKGGLKVREAKEGDQAPPMPEAFGNRPNAFDGQILNHMPEAGIVEVIGRRVTMLQFSEALQRLVRTAVWDQTGLKGNYYFGFRYAPENAPDDADAPPLAAALAESLGLKLERHKGPVEMLVIDHIEKTPTEN